MPQTHYAKSGDVSIAYQSYGAGPPDLLIVPGFVSNMDVTWEEPSAARFHRDFGNFSRVILFDKRGTGLSDRVAEGATLEERMDDVRAVMDAVDSERAVLLGYSEGSCMSVLFSVTYPERTTSLILIGSYGRLKPAPDYPWGRPLGIVNK